MRKPIDHDRCSELLAAFVQGKLDAGLASGVEAHLQGCPRCSQERAGLTALLRRDALPALSELERARLRRVVLSEAVPLPDEQTTETLSDSAPGARLYRILGTAAVLFLIGGFAYLGLGGGMGGEDSGSGGGVSSTSRDPGATDEDRLVPAQEARPLEQGSSSAEAGTADTLKGRAPAPSPTFVADLGPVDEKRLNRLGRSALPLVVFSRAYTTADVDRRQIRFIEKVASQAPPARAADIRACAGAVSDRSRNSLLAYGALAEFDKRDILVLAFAWTDEKSGPLGQSMVWAWRIGDCDGIPAHYSKNVIRPRR